MRFPVNGTGFISDTEREKIGVGDLPASVVSEGSTAPGSGAVGDQYLVRSDGTVARLPPHKISADAWGASPSNTAAQNVTAITNALASLPAAGFARGGTLTFGAVGEYLCNDTLPLANACGITLEGRAGAAGVVGGYGCSATLTYTAGDAKRFIDLRSSQGCRLRNLGIRYTHASYTGTLIDCQHGPTNDSQDVVIEGCTISGTSTATGAAYLISLDLAIAAAVKDCHLQYAQGGIAGDLTGYSNSILIDNCKFDKLALGGIANPDQDWEIRSCTFEPGLSGQMNGIYFTSAAQAAYGPVNVRSCWFGDSATGTCIQFVGNGLTLDSNFIAGGAVGLDLGMSGAGAMEAVTLIGGEWAATINVRVNPSMSADIFGLVQIGGHWLAGTTALSDSGQLLQKPTYIGGSGDTPAEQLGSGVYLGTGGVDLATAVVRADYISALPSNSAKHLIGNADPAVGIGDALVIIARGDGQYAGNVPIQFFGGDGTPVELFRMAKSRVQSLVPFSAPVASTQQSGTGGSAYTFVLADAGTVVEATGASAATFTIPTNASVAFPVGTVIEVFQDGAGQITIAGAGGVTLRSDTAKVKTAAQYATIGLRKRATDEWVLTGDLA